MQQNYILSHMHRAVLEIFAKMGIAQVNEKPPPNMQATHPYLPLVLGRRFSMIHDKGTVASAFL